jgi:hypothetical protein
VTDSLSLTCGGARGGADNSPPHSDTDPPFLLIFTHDRPPLFLTYDRFPELAAMATVGARRFQLCTVEPTTDVTDPRGGHNGTLVLSRYEETFMLSWTPLVGPVICDLASLQQGESGELAESWQFNSPFKRECGNIRWRQLHADRSLTLHGAGRGRGRGRRFLFGDAQFVSATELAEQPLINGIAVPSPEQAHCLRFYRRCRRTSSARSIRRRSSRRSGTACTRSSWRSSPTSTTRETQSDPLQIYFSKHLYGQKWRDVL